MTATSLAVWPQPYALVGSGRIVNTACSIEFPDGVVPEERYIDESLAPEQLPNPILTEEMIYYLSISSGVAALFVAVGCWLTFRKEKQHRHMEREDTPPSLQEQFRLAQQNPVESGLVSTPAVFVIDNSMPQALQTQMTGMAPIQRQETNNAVVQQFKIAEVPTSAFAQD